LRLFLRAVIRQQRLKPRVRAQLKFANGKTAIDFSSLRDDVPFRTKYPITAEIRETDDRERKNVPASTAP
jgi:hypothetical protein